MLRIMVLMIILAYSPHLVADSGEETQKQKISDTLKVYQNEVNKLKEKISNTPVITFSQSGVECHILISKPNPGIDYKILQVIPDKQIDFKALKSGLIPKKPLKVPGLNKYELRLKKKSEPKE
jgi:hypothetical protein